MVKADAWMPFYVAAYLKKTMHLTRDQHGAYILLLLACWTGGGRLPNNPAHLAAITRSTPSEWRKLAPVMLAFFKVEGDELVHTRVVEEHEKAARLSEARRQTGRLGGRPRKQEQSDEKPIGYEERSQNETPSPSPELNPLTPLEGEPPPKSRRKPKRPIPEGFPDGGLIAEQQARADAAGRELDVARVAERFRDWAISTDARYADWTATFRGWVGRDIDKAPKSASRPAPAAADPWEQRVRNFATGPRYWNDQDWGPRPGRDGCKAPKDTLARFGFDPGVVPFPTDRSAA